MCYAKPGPRCSGHAKQRLNKALESGDAARIREARREYNITPQGIAELKDAGNRRVYKYFVAQRRARMERYRIEKAGVDNKGLLYESFYPDEHLDAHVPQMFEALSKIDTHLDGKETIQQMKSTYENKIAAATAKRDKTLALLKTNLASDIDGKTPAERAEIRREYRAEVRKARASFQDDKKNAPQNWRQMEWLGFYFEEQMKDSDHNSVVNGHGPRFGNVEIDSWIGDESNRKPVDIKFHSMNNAKGHAQVEVPLNDADAVNRCIEEHGVYYLLIAKADCQYDTDESFKKWREELQGGAGKASLENAANGKVSRLRKTGADIREFSLYAITKDNMDKLGNFSQGTQHSGAARNVKYSLNFGREGLRPIMKFTTAYGVEKNKEAEREN